MLYTLDTKLVARRRLMFRSKTVVADTVTEIIDRRFRAAARPLVEQSSWRPR